MYDHDGGLDKTRHRGGLLQDVGISPVRLPRELLQVVHGHRLGGVEAMLLLHLLIRWPAQSFGSGTIMRLEGSAASRALGVCPQAIDAAARRLSDRGLLVVDSHRGRTCVRLMPLFAEMGCHWPPAADYEAVEIDAGALDRVVHRASRGRDSILLLALLLQLAPGQTIITSSAADMAERIGVDPRSVQRMLARLEQRGAIRRGRGWIDVSGPVLGAGGAPSRP